MGKKDTGKGQPKPSKPIGSKRKSSRSMFILIGIGGLLVVGALLAYRHNTPKPPPEAVNPDMLPGIQVGDAPWEAETAHLRERLDLIGLPALAAEGTGLHSHQHLDIFIHGHTVLVPAGIGIGPSRSYISPVHTHDGGGVIHVESPVVQTFTLGQFFDIWGVRLTAQCLGSHCTDAQGTLKVFVNGELAAGDPRNIALARRQEIVVAYGTEQESPKPIPFEYEGFPPGG